MYMPVHLFFYLCIYACCMYVCIYSRARVCVCVFMYACMHACMCVYTSYYSGPQIRLKLGKGTPESWAEIPVEASWSLRAPWRRLGNFQPTPLRETCSGPLAWAPSFFKGIASLDPILQGGLCYKQWVAVKKPILSYRRRDIYTK